METTYMINGYTESELDRMVEKTLAALDANDDHLVLKNGDDIKVYADGNDWTIVDDPKHGGAVTTYTHRYDAILAIKAMSRR